MGRRRIRKDKEQSESSDAEQEQIYQPPPNRASAGAPECPTRRSARQLQRQAAGTSRGKVDDDFDYSPSPPPKTQKIQRRFLTTAPKQETTATVLNRLINKRPAPPMSSRGYKIKGPPPLQRRPGHHAHATSSATLQQPGRPAAAIPRQMKHVKNMNVLPSSSSNVGWMGQGQEEALSLVMPKQDVRQGLGSMVQNPEYQQGPRKRGRKRKVDTMAQVVNQIKLEPGSRIVTVAQAQQILKGQQQRKRGRQSAATQKVKPRFPFCSICLSDEAPHDYIINHMSCPNEYQRMKRLFMYIYKDLKFPFAPFDLERENVFDYCDLPLCDSCIVLYREIYDSYAQIETAKDILTSKVERMAFKIQKAEKNAAVESQLNLIKNSPDPLMNKYSNFRKKFSNYKHGDSRGEADSSSLVQATIARVRVINQTPKRTTGSQTFLTAGHFPPPAPTKTEDQSAPTAASSKTESTEATTVIQKPIIKVEPNSSPQENKSVSGTNGASASSELKSRQPSIPVIAAPIKKLPSTPVIAAPIKKLPSTPVIAAPIKKLPSTPVINPSVKNLPSTPVIAPSVKNLPSTSSKVTAASPVPSKQDTPTSSTPKVASKPNPLFAASLASVLTIVKTPGGKGPAIIRKLPVPITTVINRQLAKHPPPPVEKKTNNASQGQEKDTASKTVDLALQVKDEPMEALREQEESEDADPFLSDSSSGKDKPPLSQKTAGSANSKRDDGDNEASSSSASEDTSDTNVFRKHKKLRATPSEDKNDSQIPSNSKNGGHPEEKVLEADTKSAKASSSTQQVPVLQKK